MIIQLKARLPGTWRRPSSASKPSPSGGLQIAQGPDAALPAATSHDENSKAIDPISVAADVLSIPSAALAVVDLADRIHKRRRASELIGHAQRLADQHVTVLVISHGYAGELRTMAPDQLLELLAGEDAPS